MLEFLQTYSASEVLIFLVMFAAAFKGAVTFWDWLVEKLRKWFGKENKNITIRSEIREGMDNINKEIHRLVDIQEKMTSQLSIIEEKVKLLTSADKADIKAWITEKHHYFCYEQKWIDDYNLDCMEKRYHYYTLEGGNSFIADLMKEIRKLPKTPPQVK